MVAHHRCASRRGRGCYVIKINHISSFDDKPGEFGYAIHGEEHGFEELFGQARSDCST